MSDVKLGTGQLSQLVTPVNLDGTVIVGGGGGGGDASAANQTAVQALAGSDASKAIAVQGITGAKAISVNVSNTPAFLFSSTIQRAANTTAYTANDVYGASFELVLALLLHLGNGYLSLILRSSLISQLYHQAWLDSSYIPME